jgi:RND family efflux transporter MFP subunit
MENADRELADAVAAVAGAEAARAAAEAAVARAVIRAPFDGVIAARLRNPGDLVQGIATEPVLRLVDPTRLEITATVAAADVPRVLPGATGRIAAATGAVPVSLSVVSRPAAATAGGDATVRLTFMEPSALAVDTRVEVDIDAEERSGVVLIPADALVREAGGSAVFVAVGNRAQRRPVVTGLVDEERVEITAGLKPGELLITRGHATLPDGATISVDLANR